MRIFSFRNIRITSLLILLAAVAIYAKDQRLVTQSWYQTLNVVIYPINIDNTSNVEDYITSLSSDDFANIDKFIKRQSENFDLITSFPTQTRLGQRLAQGPPPQPVPGSSMLDNIVWSMKLRYWIWKNAPDETDSKYTVRMFVNYHDIDNDKQLLHSVGLQKGLVGVVNAWGSRSQHLQNNIVIAHELLHTVGATDKYDANGIPVPPDGLGNPEQTPLYPQKKAEIMAGKRALSATQAEMPRNFRSLVIGNKTAQEIGWKNDI
jgi:hypothetical protein